MTFERYTEKAKHVVIQADEEARELRHGYIGTEHLLLALLKEDESLAARVLEHVGVKYEWAHDRVLNIVGRGEVVADEGSRQAGPWSRRAKRVLEYAVREALSLGHNFIGTEHLLLAITREPEGIACRLLAEALDTRTFVATQEHVRQAVFAFLRPPQPTPVEEVAPADQAREEREQNRFEPFTPGERAILALCLVSLPTLAILTDGDDRDVAGAILLDVIPLVNELAALGGTGPVNEEQVQRLRDLVEGAT